MTVDLDRELRRLGVPRRHRQRLIAELNDHLRCAPDANLGDPQELARVVADELGTAHTRRAAAITFGALAVTAVMVAAMVGWVMLAIGPRDGLAGAGVLAWGVAFVAAQVSLAAGLLAAIRAWRRRHAQTLAAAETRIIRRRAGVGLVSAAIAVVGSSAAALNWGERLPLEARLLASGGGLVSLGVLVAAAISVRLSGAIVVSIAGPPGALADDLQGLVPRALLVDPRRCAAALAALLFVVLAVAGAVQSDPYDGALRGLVEALACWLGFVCLGGYLGLVPPARTEPESPVSA